MCLIIFVCIRMCMLRHCHTQLSTFTVTAKMVVAAVVNTKNISNSHKTLLVAHDGGL